MSLKSYNTEVKVGQLWRDCDKRMRGRTRRVLAIEGDKAVMDGYPKTRVSLRRMYPHSTGWMLNEEGNGVQLGEDKSSPKSVPVTRGKVSEAEEALIEATIHFWTVDAKNGLDALLECKNQIKLVEAVLAERALVSKPEHTPDLPTPPPTTNAET